jgi:NAD(P)-dependent dehydrogenase (short-subunit alcohol dehydrogenase family)
MIQAGGGSIINVGSVNAAMGAPNLLAYSTAKGGLVTMTRNLARSLAPHRIRVNCVHPGWVLTEGEFAVQRAEGMPEDWAERAKEQIPLGRMLLPDDVAPTILFLASAAADQISGQEISVDGGFVVR